MGCSGFFVYILMSQRDGMLYTGMTTNLQRRLREHNSGRVKSTRFRTPLVLVHVERYNTKYEAERRERFLKTGRGRQVKKNLLRNMLPAL